MSAKTRKARLLKQATRLAREVEEYIRILKPIPFATTAIATINAPLEAIGIGAGAVPYYTFRDAYQVWRDQLPYLEETIAVMKTMSNPSVTQLDAFERLIYRTQDAWGEIIEMAPLYARLAEGVDTLKRAANAWFDHTLVPYSKGVGIGVGAAAVTFIVGYAVYKSTRARA